jgi:hypothetical protein
VTVGVVINTVAWPTTFAVAHTVFGNPWPDWAELSRRIVQGAIMLPILAAAWTVFPGVVVAPFLFPTVAAFALFMRPLSARGVGLRLPSTPSASRRSSSRTHWTEQYASARPTP